MSRQTSCAPLRGALSAGARPGYLKLLCGALLVVATAPLQQANDLDRQLVIAAADGDLAAVTQLLSQGADANADNGFGVTPLYTAADWGNLELVKLLLEHGAEPDSNPRTRGRSPWGKTPLMLAARSNTDVDVPEARAEIVRQLVENGAGTDGKPLGDPIRAGYFEAVRTIVGRGGVNPSYGNQALTAARRAQQDDIIELLVAAGAEEPGPLDDIGSVERIERLTGVYRAPSRKKLTLEPGLEERELLLVTDGRDRVTLTPLDQTLLRSRDRTVIVNLRSDGLPPVGLELHIGEGSEIFSRTRELVEWANPVRIEHRRVESTPLVSTTARVGEWASFRGPDGSGVADEGADPPVVWDLNEATNVAWKVPIPGLGHSSPVIWGDRVFVTSAVPMGDAPATFRGFSEAARSGVLAYVKEETPYSWRVYAFDKLSGDILWQQVATESVARTARHVMASHANQTPATDGIHLVVWFGSEGLYCYDLDGNLLWAKDLGPIPSGRYFDPGYEWNTASSPVIYKNLVILQVDGANEAYLLGLDIDSGDEV